MHERSRTKTSPSLQTLLAIAGLLTAGLTGAACGPPPKPDTLIRLENMLRQPGMAEVRTRNPGGMAEADRYRELAVKAWQDSDMTEAHDYTQIAALLYRRAEAESRQQQAEDQARRDTQRLEVARDKEQFYRAEIRKLEERIGVLTNELATADRLAHEAMLAAARKAQAAARPSPEEVAAVQQSLEGARQALTASEEVKANLYAAGRYNKARNLLGRAEQEIQLGTLDAARQTIAEASQEIEAAKVEATPKFQELEEKRKLAEMAEQLVSAAQRIQGAAVRQEPRGVVVIVSDLCPPGNKAKIKEDRAFAIEQIGKLMLDYPTVPVMLEGHTDTSPPKAAREPLSRELAAAVRDMLVEKGLEASRFTVAGYGDTMPVEDNQSASGKAHNRRVEVVFKLR